jgi:hypothetical protein
MRRVLAVAALGLLWAQAARAQGEPAVYDKDYAPAGARVRPADGILMDGKFSMKPPAKEAEALLEHVLRDVPHAEPGARRKTDDSWLAELARNKSKLSWGNMWDPEGTETPFAGLIIGGVCIPGRWQPSSPYPEILNALCFLDALSPPKVGPDMGPFFKGPAPESADTGFISPFFH